MIYRVVPFPMTFSDPLLRFQGHSASSICYAWLVFMQLTRNLFAKFLLLLAQQKVTVFIDYTLKHHLLNRVIYTIV